MTTSQQAPPQQLPYQTLPCAQCKKPMSVRNPRMRIQNFPDVSVIVFTHEKIDKCPHCGALYICMLGGISADGAIELAWIPCKSNASAIVGATSEDMERAIQTHEQISNLTTGD